MASKLIGILWSLLLVSVCNAQAGLVDPTKPSLYKPAVSASAKKKVVYKLQAIIDQQGQKMAVINGKTLKVGDTIDGHVLTWISERAVGYQTDRQSGRWLLRLSVVSQQKGASYE